jgi:hypothetical protein
MKNKLILISAISFILIAYNQARKSKKVINKRIINRKEFSQSFMMDTFKPIDNFEIIYFDDQRGLVQIYTKK